MAPTEKGHIFEQTLLDHLNKKGDFSSLPGIKPVTSLKDIDEQTGSIIKYKGDEIVFLNGVTIKPIDNLEADLSVHEEYTFKKEKCSWTAKQTGLNLFGIKVYWGEIANGRVYQL